MLADMSAPLLLVVLCAQAAPDARSTSERVHFAFRREHAVFVAGHDTHRIEADAAGTLSFFPISDRHVGPGPVPFRLRLPEQMRRYFVLWNTERF